MLNSPRNHTMQLILNQLLM